MFSRVASLANSILLTCIIFLLTSEHSIAQTLIELTETRTSQNQHPISYFTQSNSDGVLVLDANNGFFDSGSFRAEGKFPAPKNEKDFIRDHFKFLKPISNKLVGTARWHFWLEETGNVEIQFLMKVPKQDKSQKWRVELDNQSKVFTTKISDGTGPQASIKFNLESAGKQTLSIRQIGNSRFAGTEIRQIKVVGKPVKNAKVIRARWRPAAAHARFRSSTCSRTQMWVFESQSQTKSSSYSPMTTSFGYYGASFGADGNAAGGVNFSMWAASSKAKDLPPLDQLPRLLSTGNAKAEFSGFGHEGSGVKIRNWEPFRHKPKSVIQALRVETTKGFDTFYGYLYNETSNRWILYAAGKRPVKSRQRNKNRTTLIAGSFVEVPGPASSQRSGDQLRVIRRRGWFFGDDKKWHRADKQLLGDSTKEPGNRFIGQTEDGWFLTATGGVEMLGNRKKEIQLNSISSKLPVYLNPQTAKQLFELPIEFQSSKVISVNPSSASIEYRITKCGTNAKGRIYFGRTDCITNIKRKIHGTERKGLSQKMLSADRTWESNTELQNVQTGSVQFRIKNLNPNTRYYYRILVTSDQGKSWDFKSGQFQTPK